MTNFGFNLVPKAGSPWNAKFTEHLLLVEADPGLRESRRLLLCSLGVQVHAVGTHREVYQLLRETPYSLVILDVPRDPDQATQFAEFAGARWPAAKILLLGRGCSLDDWLYDDVFDPYCNPGGFIQCVQSMLERAQAERLIR
jgi:hypothetical protein